ncbi:MAG: sigma-70 family RNA polymerase sigma factor [Thermodesulfobacteriota bacterium]
MAQGGEKTKKTSEHEQSLAELIDKIARGCESALKKLYDTTITQVYGLAYRILNNQPDADEVALDVFKQIWNKAPDYEPGRGTPSAWLITLTRSRAIDRIRSDTKRRTTNEPIYDDSIDDTPLPDETRDILEKREVIMKALSELTPKQRESIELAYFKGLSQSEISKHMNEPLGTVKSWMRTGMIKLKDILAT